MIKELKKAIIVTTINLPTQAVREFAHLPSFHLFVAGDNKTPSDWKLDNTTFLPINLQKKKYPLFSDLSSENHYSRKNFAYIEAVKSNVEFIYETDDDNFPNEFFPNFLLSESTVDQIDAPPAFNIYSMFTKRNVWPRGLPLNRIKITKKSIKKKKVKPLIQQSLADLDPDVDAIYRLVLGDEIKFYSNKKFSFAKQTYGPFNSQNTFWHKEAFPLLYLPSTVSNRATDIWRGYIAQRILWEMGTNLIYLSPCVYQKRNIHNFMKDLEDEVEVYVNTERLINILDNTSLSGTPSQMLLKVYKKLVAEKFVIKRELDAVEEWVKIISS